MAPQTQGTARFQVVRNNKNSGLFLIMSVAYILTLLLFGWQTWGFVDFLFPNDQLLMKILTLFSFDIMSLIWGCAHRFYNFAHPHAKTAVAWGFGITTFLSFVATIIYMVIQSMFRFHLTVGPDIVNVGYGVTIGALVLNIMLLATFLYQEIGVRAPNYDEFVEVDALPNKRTVDAVQPPRLPAAQRQRTLSAPPMARKSTSIPFRTHTLDVYEDEEGEADDEVGDEMDDEEDDAINVQEQLIVNRPQSYTTGQFTGQRAQSNVPGSSSSFAPRQHMSRNGVQKMSSHPVEQLHAEDAAPFQSALPIPIQQYVVNARQGNGLHGQAVTHSSSPLAPSIQQIPVSQPLPTHSQPLREEIGAIQEASVPKSEQFNFPPTQMPMESDQ